MHLSSLHCSPFPLTLYVKFWKPLLLRFGIIWTFAPAHAPARMPLCAPTFGGLPRFLAPSCSCPLVHVACSLSCGLDWGATTCRSFVVGGVVSLGLKVSACTVLRMLSGMNGTKCSNAQPCSQFGRNTQLCLGPLLLLCSNSCGRGTFLV